ncbi:M15 family metallopeptidase [Pseudomonas vancouverensis]|uniref:M15 family peptidase n=1 Tax=Pseudomonas vancouverensis TaxID=95300 RepID=A0A1H2NVT5_PSEVA|nr:M15 family metallopeptidase [Pseudomonas vancouverensis]KAB0496420.1 M15 family metallopeptidase [Pseudomonas vancouverensis]TDB64872.1 M15 family peptidase [Pseudomonas vancouverensis]SDV09569.1 D-alanyl-D-alanine carboxypeptidase [Pseudomonas vancouverensis]
MDERKSLATGIVCALLLIGLSERAQAGIFPVMPELCELMKATNVITDENPVGCDRLRVVSFDFTHFEGHTEQGSVMVLDAFAPYVQTIFDDLHRAAFPLRKARGLEHYLGDDKASMADNNTSAFNGRPITGGSSWSLHAYGAAIDLNPIQNPFIDIQATGQAMIDPVASARAYVNRMQFRAEKPERFGLAEPVVDTFAFNGFIHWGGYWNYPVDFQHFEVAPRSFLQHLASVSAEQAAKDFDGYVAFFRGCLNDAEEQDSGARRARCVGDTLEAYRQR